MAESSDNSAESLKRAEIGRDAAALLFAAELFANRIPDTCETKDCPYRSQWCFAASHAELYSIGFKTEH